jgi:hypothetical protein
VLEVDVCKIELTQFKKSRRRFEFVKYSTESFANCTGDAEPKLGLEINKLIYVTKKNIPVYT